MPATAGRVRMPANNRVHSSAALQTHGIWQSAIGYDPYAPTNKDEDASKGGHSSKPGDDGPDNAYASFQGLLALARITGSNTDDTRGACKRCGRVGHLTFQCRNFLSVKDDKDKDATADAAALQTASDVFEKIKKAAGKKEEEGEESDEEEDPEEESESSDSDMDPEIEKIITERFGKKKSYSKKRSPAEEDSGEEKKGSRRRRGRSKKRSGKRSSRSDETDSEEEYRRREKRRRRRRGGSDDDVEEEDGGCRHRKSRKEKKRRRSHHKRDESDESSEESGRRRGHKPRHGRKDLSGSDSDGSADSLDDRKRSTRHHERRRKRRSTSSESNASDDEESRGRKGKMQSEDRSRNHRREEKN